MKNAVFVLVWLFVGCSVDKNIKLNDIQVSFTDFEETDSLIFTGMSEEVIEEPSEMRVIDNYLIINNFNKLGDDFITLYDLESNGILKTCLAKGSGPYEMASCSICTLGDELWLYDMGKSQIGRFPVAQMLNDTLHPDLFELSRYYYDVTMLNDTIMVGSNDLSSSKKISFVNLKNGNITYAGDYSYLNGKIPEPVLIDACNCYIDVNPKTKAILLSYRYTDVIEIYDSAGCLKHSLHGPECFDIKFKPGASGMRKTKETRKAFVNSYVTDKHIYLLYSGCTRGEKNWSNGTEIFVYSWNGTPEKRYILNQPVYSFAVDESRGYIYSFSLETSELVKAAL